MNPAVITSILSLIQYAPQALTEVQSLYNAINGDLSATDQSQIDAALAQAIAADTQATAAADQALDSASKR